MTKKQKIKYLKNPTECPICASTHISAEVIEADSSTAWSRVECQTCGATWKDIYTLTDVE